VLIRAQAIDGKLSELGAHQPHDGKADRLAEPADLSVLAFFERQLEPGLSILDAKNPHVDWLGRFAVDDDGLLEASDCRIADLPLHFGDVDLFDRTLRVQ
jgi:hypothetical protein